MEAQVTNETASSFQMPVAAPSSYPWLCLDLETANGRPEDAEYWARRHWSPSSAWKDETIGKRYREALEKKKDKLALLDPAPIICVSLRTPNELRCLHWMYQHEPRDVHGGLVESFATQKDMLVALRNLMDVFVAPDTLVVGHNILGFDLPKLRWMMVREGVRLPACLVDRDQPVYDIMVKFCREYSTKRDIMVGLSDVLEEWGIDSHKQLVDGSEVPELYEAKQYDTIIGYALLDAIAEAQVFQRMTGEAEGLA